MVAPGTAVKKGDVIAVVETQKGLFEVEVYEDGILGPPLVQPGEEVPVGTVLAVIAVEGETPVEVAAPAEEPPVITSYSIHYTKLYEKMLSVNRLLMNCGWRALRSSRRPVVMRLSKFWKRSVLMWSSRI